MPSTEASPMRGIKATIILADFAQVTPDNKLTVVGGGWTVMGNQTPFALAGVFEVPWHLTNQQHSFRFDLIDDDGNAVTAETLHGPEVLMCEGQFEAGRPSGVRAGTAIPIPFALPHGPVLLPPGSHFEWRLLVNGETDEDWRLAFSTLPSAQSEAA